MEKKNNIMNEYFKWLWENIKEALKMLLEPVFWMGLLMLVTMIFVPLLIVFVGIWAWLVLILAYLLVSIIYFLNIVYEGD